MESITTGIMDIGGDILILIHTSIILISTTGIKIDMDNLIKDSITTTTITTIIITGGNEM